MGEVSLIHYSEEVLSQRPTSQFSEEKPGCDRYDDSLAQMAYAANGDGHPATPVKVSRKCFMAQVTDPEPKNNPCLPPQSPPLQLMNQSV